MIAQKKPDREPFDRYEIAALCALALWAGVIFGLILVQMGVM